MSWSSWEEFLQKPVFVFARADRPVGDGAAAQNIIRFSPSPGRRAQGTCKSKLISKPNFILFMRRRGRFRGRSRGRRRGGRRLKSYTVSRGGIRL